MPSFTVTAVVRAELADMTALTGLEATPAPGGARIAWTTPPVKQGVTEIRVRWRTAAGPGAWSTQLTFGFGTDRGDGKHYGDLLALPAEPLEVELQPYREATA